MSSRMTVEGGSVFDAPPGHDGMASQNASGAPSPRTRSRNSPIAWAAFLLALAALALTLWQGAFRAQEQAALVVTRTPDDLPVRLDTSGGRAALVADWQIIVANNSTRDITLTASSVTVALPAGMGVHERPLAHGYRSEDQRMRLDFPHIITAGHVAQFLVRVRLPLGPQARDVLAALLQSDSSAALWDAANLLMLRGIDPLDSSDTAAGAVRLAAVAETTPPEAPPTEHVFAVRLRSQRGTVFEDFVTWSEISGLTARH